MVRWPGSPLIVLAVVVLNGCLSVGLGPLQVGGSQQAGVPLLYADPGVAVVREGIGDIGYEAGMVLKPGDSITTGDGQAVIDFDDGHVVALNTATVVQLGSIRLFFGELFTRLERLTERGGGRVLTNELSASVEGTEYAVRRSAPNGNDSVDPDGTGRTEVIVRRGVVTCDPAGGADWARQTVRVDQMLDVYGTKAAVEMRSVDASLQTRWADQAIERLLRPRAYVPDIGVVLPLGRPDGGGDRGGDRGQTGYR